MKSISDYFAEMELFLVALLILIFVIKTVLYFRVEKYWDSLKFFHYSKIDLKMTSLRHLRVWRKRQNTLTLLLGILLFLFTLLYSFHQIIAVN